MIKRTLILEGYLKYKYSSKTLTIDKVLENAKISSADVFFIKVGDLIVKEDYLLTESAEVKLFPIIGGG